MERVGNSFQWQPITDKDLARTLCAGSSRFTDNYICEGKDKIRKLTPYEYLRLMGVSDAEAKKICKSNMSDSAIYKLAGNSIVVDVLAAIFGQLFKSPNLTLQGNSIACLGRLKESVGRLKRINRIKKKL